jgi:iron complex outermembrane recepter protein
MRLSVAVAAGCLSLAGLCVADDTEAAIRKPTNIPAEGLVPALKQLAHERNLQVVFQSEVVGTTRTHGAVGEFTAQEALKQLLEGTNLIYRFLDDKTITILPVSSGEGSGAAPAQPSSGPPPTSSSQKEPANSGAFLLAQATTGQASGALSLEQEQKHATGSELPLQEVIVTAQKRQERLQDVPVPVTVLPATELSESNQLRIQDYFARVPGLSVTGGSSSSSYQEPISKPQNCLRRMQMAASWTKPRKLIG